MDLLDNATLSHWLIHYGGFVLFILLTLGIIAFPVPEETLMVLAGVLMHSGKLHIFPTILATMAGSICGISISYILGRTAGNFLVHRFGGWVGITEKKLKNAHDWFQRFGKWTLLIGYFIPGVRHFTGFSAGTTKLEYKIFALFAYVGAFIWVTTFLSIGYFFGNYWLSVLQHFEANIDELLVVIIIVCLIFGIVIYRHFKK